MGIKRNPLCFILRIHTETHTQQGVWTKEFRTEKDRQTGRQAQVEKQREAYKSNIRSIKCVHNLTTQCIKQNTVHVYYSTHSIGQAFKGKNPLKS